MLRLRAAGVSFEDRQDLLGYRSGRMIAHYSAAELTKLIEAANSVCKKAVTGPKNSELTDPSPCRIRGPQRQQCTPNLCLRAFERDERIGEHLSEDLTTQSSKLWFSQARKGRVRNKMHAIISPSEP